MKLLPPRMGRSAGPTAILPPAAHPPVLRRSEPLQQWELDMPPGKEVECLIDKLKVHFLGEGKHRGMFGSVHNKPLWAPPSCYLARQQSLPLQGR